MNTLTGSILDQGGAEKTGDGFGQLSRTLGARRRECQAPLQAMTFDTKLLKEVRTSPQSMLGEYRVAETRLHEALDRFRVISLHQHVGCHPDLVEKPVDDHAHIASLWVKQKGGAGEFRSSQRADMSAARLVCRGAHDEQFFVKKRNEEKADFGNGERDERQVKAAIGRASCRERV